VKYEIRGAEEAPEGTGLALPVLTFPRGQTISQTPAILAAVGKQLGLSGETLEEKAACDQCVLDMNDICDEVMSGKLFEDASRTDKWFSLLEAKLQGHKFMVADTPTVADFHGVFTFAWYFSKWERKILPRGILPQAKHTPVGYERFPKLVRWWSNLCQWPSVQRLLDSGIQLIPVNAPTSSAPATGTALRAVI